MLSLPEVYELCATLPHCCEAKPQKKVRTGGTYIMSSFVAFMQSTTGRILRIVVGIALIALGLLVIQGVWGIVLAVIGLVPLIAGLGGVCLVAPLFGFTLKGQQKPAA
jgi:predicted RND superfamily exporter protein